MPNLNTAQFTLGYGTLKRSLGERLEGYRINVKDFGAVGDGSHDDTANIQAAFDYAFGTEAEPNGSANFGVPSLVNAGHYVNKVVFFPAGDYRVTATLALNIAFGAVILGAGSYSTRIFFDPEADEDISEFSAALPDEPEGNYNYSSLLECRCSWLTHMEGITLDAGGVQQNAMRVLTWAPTDYPAVAPPGHGDDGSGGNYRDVHLTNAVVNGFWSFGNRMGSERIWVNCRFTNCENGHNLAQGNALNHSFLNCLFADNDYGMLQGNGGSGSVMFCRFENNSKHDIVHKQSQLRIVGCHSTSQNFVHADGAIFCCTHTNATEGLFWSCTAFHALGSTEWVPDPPMPPLAIYGPGISMASIKGNHSTNGIMHSVPGGGSLHMMGNTFDNADYLDNTSGITNLWEDGIDLNA